MTSGSVTAYFSIIFISLLPISIFIVFYYAEPGFPWHTYITLILAYYSAFAILLLVPIDIASIVVDRRSTDTGKDAGYDSDTDALNIAYNTFFTFVLILGSFILLLQEYFNSDGYFTVNGRFLSSFKRMAKDNAPGVIVGVIVLGILLDQNVVEGNIDALKLAAIIVTNTVYEAFLMFLLAYAMVEYPRAIWMNSDLDKYLLKTQMKAASEFKDISDAQLSVSLAVSDVLKTKNHMSTTSAPELIKAIEIMISECPPEFRSDRLGKVALEKKSGKVTIDSLAALRTRLNIMKSRYKMAQAKVEGTKLLAYRLEDIVTAKNTKTADTIHWSLTDKNSTTKEYNWEIIYKPILYKIFAVILAVMSIFSFLGVICSMEGVDNSVSVYFRAVHDSDSSTGGIAVFILLTLGYTVYITTWALFQVRTSGNKELVAHRTTPGALSFNVRMVARLAAPLAFFYLGWIAENGIREGDWQYNDAPDTNSTQLIGTFNATTNTTTYTNETIIIDNTIFMPSAFSNFYQLQNVGAIKSTFGTIFPVLFIVALALFVLNAFNRILVLLKLENYQFGEQIVTEEQLREGKRQLLRHKKTTERAFRREDLKGYILKAGKKTRKSIFGIGLGALFSSGETGNTPLRESTSSTKEGAEPEVAKAVIREPNPIDGMLERKKDKKKLGMVSQSWKECYCVVRSPGYLHLYKDKKAATEAASRSRNPSSSPDPTAIVLDLRMIMNFSIPDRKNKDNLVLEIELPEETMKLKMKSLDDVERWQKELMEWKDFNIDYGVRYPYGLAAGAVGGDVESNQGIVGTTSINPMMSPVKNERKSNEDDFNFEQFVDEDVEEQEEKGVRPLIQGSQVKSLRSKKGETSDNNPNTATTKAANAAAAAKATAERKVQQEMQKSQSNTFKANKPVLLEGWLEKKGKGSRMMKNDWQKRYLRIDENTGSLTYSKSSDPSEPISGTIDLTLARSITSYDKTGTLGKDIDHSRFGIEMEDRTYKFRADNPVEGQRWKEGLEQWQDYFLLNMGK